VPKWEWFDAYVLGKFVTVKSPIWTAYYGWRKHTILHNQHGLYQLLCYHYAKMKQLLTSRKKKMCLQMRVQAGLILCDLFFHRFTLTWLENLHHFSNLRNNFQFNDTWHWWSMATFIFCRRLTEGDVTPTPSVTYIDWLHWRYQHVAHVVSSSTTSGFSY